MAVYVGRWDCTSCGYKGVLGPERECSNCGADRPKNVQFYMADEQDIVQDPEVLKKAQSGPDWACSYCGENNKAFETNCKSCGNNRNAAQGDKNLAVKTYATKDVPRSGDNTRRKKVEQAQAPKVPRKINRKGCLIALAILAILVFIFGQSSEIFVTVEGFEWQRSIAVEEHKKVEESDWKLPSGGTLISSSREIHHYNSILDHYETRTRTQTRVVGTEEYVCGKKDMGNGYFEDEYCTRDITEQYEEEYEEPVYRKEPVYQTKYRYSIYRWKPISPIVTSGKDQNARWGDTRRVAAESTLREGKRTEMYAVMVRDEKNETHRHEIPKQKWESLEIGAKLKAKRGLVGDYRGLEEEDLQ